MSDTVKSARRVLEVFEYFARVQRAAGVGEVARALGYPQSSTSVLLHSLALQGYLSHDRQRRTFHPTLRIRALVHWMVAEVEQVRSLFAAMRTLAEQSGHTVTLGIQKDLHVLYLTVTEASRPGGFHMRPGQLRPLCRTGIGLALLSLRTDREVRAIVSRINAERPEDEPLLHPETVLERVGRARRLGYAMTLGTATPGAGVIARVVPEVPGQPPMAVGIGMPIAELAAREADWAAMLTAAFPS